MRTPIEATSGSDGARSTFVYSGLAEAQIGDEVDLSSAEVGHARSARVRIGEAVTLTDGKGTRWTASLTALERRTGRCRLVEPCPSESPPAVSLWIPVANRDRTLWLVEKSVELGVASIRWIEWERSKSVADAARSDAFRVRSLTRAEAALKQSGGAWIPDIYDVVSLPEALALARRPNEIRWLADARGEPSFAAATRLSLTAAEETHTVSILVGPEGGFTDEEAAICSAAGFDSVSVGERTLRFETAAIAMLGLAVSALGPARR